MEIRTAQIDDLPELLEIYNYEVINGISTLDLQPKTLDERKEWFYEHNIDNHPLVLATIDGHVAGYASLSSYREKEAYKSTVELSIYIHPNYRKLGVATKLMEHLLDIARKDDSIHAVVSVITHGNEASEKLHKKFGFEFCGTIKEVGMKFGVYQDIDNYNLLV